MSEELFTPPFCKESTTPQKLFEILTELHDWVVTQADWANMEASRLGYPGDTLIKRPGYVLGDGSKFLAVAVPDMFFSWYKVRQLREKYDDIVRNYENADEWGSDACIYHRITLIKQAADLLEVAFLDYEKKEAKEYYSYQSALKKFEGILKKFYREGSEDDKPDIDKNMFN